MVTNVSHSTGRSEPWKSSATRQRKMVSVTFPVFDEQDNVVPLYEEVTSVLDKTKIKYELIFPALIFRGSTLTQILVDL